MTHAIFNGILLGLLISVLIGPVFFMLIHVSMKEGFRSAMALDAGILLSDAFCIVIAWLGMARLLEDPMNKQIFIVAGSIVLIVLGVLKLRKPRQKPASDSEIKIRKSNPLWLLIQGFIYNLLNPSTLIFWITTVGGAVTYYQNDTTQIYTQFGATLSVVLGIDLMKAWFAKKMGKFMTPVIFRKLNIYIGIIFVIFGIALIVRLIFTES